MKNIDSQEARRILANHYDYPPTTPIEAGILINGYMKGEHTLPEHYEALIYMALQVLRDENMGSNHPNDIKREQRSHARTKRKFRTGSRK